MKGLLIKKYSNFYYVKTNCDNRLYECMSRERLKKEDLDIVVGDYVEIDEVNNDSCQAVITYMYPRETYIQRPHIANMDQNIIIMSLNQPPINLNQLDRFIVHTQLSGLNHIVCINKCDLKDKKNLLPHVKDIYMSLGIEVIEISAKNKMGLDTLCQKLKNKKTIFSGPSGVGKSTIINTLKPELNIKIGNVGSKSQKGTHTTRHIELISIDFQDNSSGIVADTPGFSYLRFDKYLPEQIEEAFSEFMPYKDSCSYSNCLHLSERECGVKNNLHHLNTSRYDNYCKFVSEALEYKEKLTSLSKKIEGRIKTIDSSGKNQIRRLKLGYNLVDASRKSYNQKLTSTTAMDNSEESYNDTLDS